MEKLNQDEEKLIQFRSNHVKSQTLYRKKLLNDESNCKNHRLKNAEYMRAYRAKKKASSITSTSNSQQSTSFSSKNALKVASQRVLKALPKNDEKAREVLKYISKKKIYSLESTVTLPMIQKKRKSRCDDDKKIALEFYNFDLITYQFPGKNDFKRIKDSSGIVTQVQKRQMLMTESDAYQKLRQMFPLLKLSMSSFRNLRPSHIVSYDKIKQNYCTCPYCQNMLLWFESVSPFIISEIEDLRELMIKLLCCRENYMCCENSCNDCEDTASLLDNYFIQGSDNEPINMMTWCKNADTGYTQKQLSTIKTVESAKEWFLEKFSHFAVHKYLIKTQFQRFRELKINLDGKTAFITMDFSNNYQTLSQDEVQAAYFARKYIEIFTCIIHILNHEPISYIVVNDVCTHSKEHVFFYIKLIIDDLKKKHARIENVHFISDGATSQFKNKYTLSNLLFAQKDFGITAIHEFSPSNHGKNAVDGLGGIIKRGVFKKVMSKKVEVYDAEAFVKCARPLFKDVTIFHAKEDEIQQLNKKLLAPRWKKLIKNSAAPRDCHYFEPRADGKSLLAAISSKKEKSKIIKFFA